ncbi:hypothetical protein VNI00_003825 [Paramarasmius palmivorus]|uniref:Terpene synthase n=1 Tax=Paramarasmius palmivorus TaxID=297713 RepID=A0AAW0DQF0_9AGAR
MSQSQTYVLPDTLRDWPWPRSINPFYDICKAEASIDSYGAFTSRSQRAFERCDFRALKPLHILEFMLTKYPLQALLASLNYPKLNKDGNRIGCDLMNLFFVVDEYTDVASAEEARRLVDIVMDALRNPDIPRPPGEWIGGEIARALVFVTILSGTRLTHDSRFWKNAMKTGTPSFQRHFLDTFAAYLDSCVEQASDRGQSRVRDIATYFTIRRQNIGSLPSFAVLGVHMNLADNVLNDPVIQRLTMLSTDMLILGNDICSYNVEQARGDDSHNIVRIMMDSYGTDVQGALNYVSLLHDHLATEFLELITKVPTFGDTSTDKDVSVYVDGLGHWVRGNDCWSFESQRYFGPAGLEIQKTRIVQMLPKVDLDISRTSGLFEWTKRVMTHLWPAVFGETRQQPLDPVPAAIEIVV